jgi:hypothetical protein
MNHQVGRTDVAAAVAPPRVTAGEYLCSERELYRVEHVGRDRGLVENCRTGNLIDIPLVDLLALRRVA